jgi:probable DNA metabolism protein
LTLVYPAGDFEAFLTAILETWVHRAPEWDIVPDTGGWFGPEGPRRAVTADPESARRILDGLETHSGPAARRVFGEAFRHGGRGREASLAEFVRACVRYRRTVLDREADPVVREVLRRSRAVRAEAHRFLGLVRFQSVSGAGWYGRFEPEHDVLGMLAEPFDRRMAGQDWMLHDASRSTAWVVREGVGELLTGVRIDPAGPGLEPHEAAVQNLWRTYFSTIAIRERTNPRLQRSKMPKKTWKNLVERPGE